MIFLYKNNARRLGHMPRTLPPDSLARLATPRGGPRSLCFRCKGFPPSNTTPTQVGTLRSICWTDVFLSNWFQCMSATQAGTDRDFNSRDIKVGLRMFNADGRRLEDSHMLWPLLARPLNALAGLEWFCEAGSNVGACVEDG